MTETASMGRNHQRDMSETNRIKVKRKTNDNAGSTFKNLANLSLFDPT